MITDNLSTSLDSQTVLYFCQTCTTDFSEYPHLNTCPCCGVKDQHSMVKIYIDHDPEVDQMYTKTDWMAGD
ncbi:hypothetical protein GC174_07270 [bacterium]|nr:hypothetical protein [bacterium]